MQRFETVFGTQKPVIAMVHLGALPGTPLHDKELGLVGLVEAARADLAALQSAGVDAIMFGNENDRPYEFSVDTASTATMAYVIGATSRSDYRAIWRKCPLGSTQHYCAGGSNRCCLLPGDIYGDLRK